MLSAADRALAQRDPALPGLALLLDEQALLAHLPRELAVRAGGTIRRTYIRYKPGMNCLVRYRLGTGERTLHIHAKVHGADADVKLARAGSRRGIEVGGLPGRITLPEAGIVICLFPNDDKLKQLYRIGDDAGLAALLRDMLPHHPELHGAHIEPLQYKPERRLVACLHGQDGSRAAIKFYERRGYAAAMQALQGEGNPVSDWFPLLLGYSDKHLVVVSEWIDGPVLSECAGEPAFNPGLATELGRQLALFHRQDNDSDLPVRPLHEEIGKLERVATGLAVLAPALQQRVERLVDRLRDGLLALSPRFDCIHGDFYAKQVLCTAQGIQLLDSDEVSIGHAAADVGLFVAHLQRDVLRGRLTAARAAALEAGFMAGYRRHGPALAPHAVTLFGAAGLLQLLHHPFRNCEPDWEAGMAAILTLAEQRLERVAEPVPVAVPATVRVEDPDDACSDPALPCLREALQPERIEPALRACLQQCGHGAEVRDLVSIRVLRHRPGRRCLVEYCFSGANGGITLMGKLRARGLDRRTWNLNEALHGCSEDGGSGLQVPEPLGAIDSLHMWLQRRVDGEPGWQALTGTQGVSVARRIAAALAGLHRAGIPVDRVHGSYRELEILERNIALAAGRLPQWAPRLERVLAACRKLAAGLPAGEIVGIHRDFYHDQVIVRDDAVCLLDLDLYCHGDAALDVGNFLAHVEEQCLREFGDTAALDDVCTAFAEHYRAARSRVRSDAIDIWRRLSLARHLGISQRIPARNRYTGQLLELCEQQLGLRTRCMSGGLSGTTDKGKRKAVHENIEIPA